MAGSEARGVPASAALRGASRSVGVLVRKGIRSPWLVVVLLVLVATGAFLLGRSSAPASVDQQLPPHVGVPAHARLVRREDYVQAHIQNWYYAVPGASHAALTVFYHAQLSQDGWHCFRSTTSTSIIRDGKAYSGSSV